MLSVHVWGPYLSNLDAVGDPMTDTSAVMVKNAVGSKQNVLVAHATCVRVQPGAQVTSNRW